MSLFCEVSLNVTGQKYYCIGIKLRILFSLLCIHFHTQIFLGDKNGILFRHFFLFFYLLSIPSEINSNKMHTQ